MDRVYWCKDAARRLAVSQHPTANGIESLEVLDHDAPPSSPPQRTLFVRFFKPLVAPPAVQQVVIEGGVRVTPVHVDWALRADLVPAPPASPAEQALFAGLTEPDRVLVVRTDSHGDFSTYRLRLRTSLTDTSAPPGFDPLLSAVDFSFKVECPSDFDCAPPTVCPEPVPEEPVVDYLAKDYASFRRLMLDRLSATLPEWRERNPADLGMVLVELLAHAGDELSYYQDAVATEAYLGTARRRVSVRRHARLLDYRLHDGCNARAWVALEVAPGSAADGLVVPAGTPLLTGTREAGPAVAPARLTEALAEGAEAFETLHAVRLRAVHNRLRFYTWVDEDCCLPQGATQATLLDEGPLALAAGDVLVLEEERGPESGRATDAELTHRHAVRLTHVEPRTDPLTGTAVVDVAWSVEDAVPFALCVAEVPDPEMPGLTHPVSVARANVVLCDHGRTVGPEALGAPPASGPFRPRLARRDLTHQARVSASPGAPAVDPTAPAAAALRWDMGHVLPALTVVGEGRLWEAQRDLLVSDRFAAHLVAETESDGRTTLRFGDGVLGRRPSPGLGATAAFVATYRVGQGPAGNVGADSIGRLVLGVEGVLRVRNPLAATGGEAPEPLAAVRRYAPWAFRRQERAVTPEDYAEVTERHSEVQKAAVTLRWTGSWHTVFVTVDRLGGRPVDAAFEEDLRAHLERYRMAGHDVEIEPARAFPLDVAVTACVRAGYFRSAVKSALRAALGAGMLPDGRLGFFHPDRFTFGQPVYLSALYAAAMAVDGLRWVDVTRFQGWGRPDQGELQRGAITPQRLEVARLDNDPNAPENGRLVLDMRGGL